VFGGLAETGSDDRLLWLITLILAIRAVSLANTGSYLKERQRLSRERIKSLPLSDEAVPPAGGYKLDNLQLQSGINKPSPAANLK
jgi:hypothetical protein